ILMERISRALELVDEPASMNWIETNVEGKRDALRTAVTQLVADGHIEQQQGPRNSRLLTSLKPYREADDAPSDDLAPTSPHLAPKRVDLGTSSSPHPFRGGEEGEVVERAGAKSSSPHQNGHVSAPLEQLLDTQPEKETAW